MMKEKSDYTMGQFTSGWGAGGRVECESLRNQRRCQFHLSGAGNQESGTECVVKE